MGHDSSGQQSSARRAGTQAAPLGQDAAGQTQAEHQAEPHDQGAFVLLAWWYVLTVALLMDSLFWRKATLFQR